jgi:hypothetical protein
MVSPFMSGLGGMEHGLATVHQDSRVVLILLNALCSSLAFFLNCRRFWLLLRNKRFLKRKSSAERNSSSGKAPARKCESLSSNSGTKNKTKQKKNHKRRRDLTLKLTNKTMKSTDGRRIMSSKAT